MIDRRGLLTLGGLLGGLAAPENGEGAAVGAGQLSDKNVQDQQPLVLARDVNGRYTMMFNFTALVLKQEAVHDFIGIACDNR